MVEADGASCGVKTHASAETGEVAAVVKVAAGDVMEEYEKEEAGLAGALTSRC